MKNIVIIGAGLGGLTAGALLAKDGYKVTLLEQHNIVGGCATTFKRGDYTCEVGLHEMDGVYTNPQIKKIFDKLDVYTNVEFVKVPEFFKTHLKNDTFIMPDGLDASIKALSKKFPNEKKAIERYFTLMGSIIKAYEDLQNMKWYHYLFFPFYFKVILQYKNKSTTEVMNQLFNDEKLKMILNSNVQYYNDTPDDLSFLLHSLAQYSYYRGGGYFIKGGSGRLSDYLASIIEDRGGLVVTKAKVIECNNTEVKYLYKKEEKTIKADKIISNLSPQDTYRLFNHPYNESKELADSLLTIYIGFNKNLKSVYGKQAYSTFFLDDMETINDFKKMSTEDISKRSFVFVDYSQIDSGLTKNEEKSFGVVCCSDYIDDWSGLTQETYKLKKEELEQRVIRKLENYYPNISNYIEYIETGTAKTVADYIKTPKGTAYGYKPTPEQFFRVPKSKSKEIKNLYFVGQWIIGGGFSPSIMSGDICFREINKN